MCVCVVCLYARVCMSNSTHAHARTHTHTHTKTHQDTPRHTHKHTHKYQDTQTQDTQDTQDTQTDPQPYKHQTPIITDPCWSSSYLPGDWATGACERVGDHCTAALLRGGYGAVLLQGVLRQAQWTTSRPGGTLYYGTISWLYVYGFSLCVEESCDNATCYILYATAWVQLPTTYIYYTIHILLSTIILLCILLFICKYLLLSRIIYPCLLL